VETLLSLISGDQVAGRTLIRPRLTDRQTVADLKGTASAADGAFGNNAS